MRLDDLARIDRHAARVRERLRASSDALAARGFAGNPTLRGWCGIASVALVTSFRAAGLVAELASGWFVDDEKLDADPHYWALVGPAYGVVPEQWPDYATIIDITATQFLRFVDAPVVRLAPGALERIHYELDEYGDHLLHGLPVQDQRLALTAAVVGAEVA